MRPHLKRALVLATLSPLVLASPVSADPGQRASTGMQTYQLPRECFTPDGAPADAEECVSVSGRFNTVETPSGIYKSVDKATETFTYTEPGITEAGTKRIHYNLVEKDGRVLVENTRMRVETTINGVPCTGKGRRLVIKDQVKRETETGLTCAGTVPGVTP